MMLSAPAETCPEPTVLVIGVNYETDDLAIRFVRGLTFLSSRPGCNVVVVDNSRPRGQVPLDQRLEEIGAKARFVKSPENLGYLGGAKLGLSVYLREAQLPDWVVVCNVDLEFRDESLTSGLRTLCGCGEVGVVAPAVCSEGSGEDMNPYMVSRPSAMQMRFYKYLYASSLATAIYISAARAKGAMLNIGRRASAAAVEFVRARSSPDGSPDGDGTEGRGRSRTECSRRIYAPHGSCLIFARRFFERGGSLDFPAFLFAEEIFVAEQLLALGLEAIYCPGIRVLHREHSSTLTLPSSTTRAYLRESARVVADRYFA